MGLLSYVSLIVRRSAAIRFPYKCQGCTNNVRNASSIPITNKAIHEVNTKVVKDVILYKYENAKFFKYMNAFAVIQYMFWSYLGIFAFSSLRDAPVDESKVTHETPWYRRVNLGENKYRNGLGTIAVLVGKY